MSLYKITTQPAAEPVSLTEVKLHLKLVTTSAEATAYTDEDTLLSLYLQAARQAAEEYTWRKFITTTVQQVFNRFDGCLDLVFPAIEVSGLVYYDSEGAEQTLATSVYELDNFSLPAKIYRKSGQSWPSISSSTLHPIRVTFTSGFGATAADVPGAIREAILLAITDLYENREDKVQNLPRASRALLHDYRLWKF